MTSTNKYERDLVSHQSNQQRTSNRVGCYEIIKTIGKGNFATVKLASHIYTKENVAIKIVDKTRMDPENLKKVEREIDILRKLDHPHIIKLYQVMHSEKALYLVTEYAPGGEVFDQLLSNGKMLEKDARRCFKQICTALYYCHQRNVVHRDLKVENVLLDINGDVKLADFGFSNYQKEGHLMKTWCGSPPYAAPELFEGREYNGPKADVWSLGVVLFVLVCGGLPFEDTDLPTLRTRVLSGKYRIPFYMSHECEDLLRRMLKVDPDQRYTLKQVFRHPWMKIGGPDPNFEKQIKECEDLERDKKEESLDDHLLNEMERAGLNRERVVTSIKLKRFDNFSTCYYLMLTKWQRYKQTKTTNPIINNPHLLHNIKTTKPSLLSGPPITEAVINDQLMDVNMMRDQRLYELVSHANLIDVNHSLMSSSSRPETIPQIELRDENSQVIQINDDNVLLDTDSDSEEPQPQALARYLSQGRRHTYGVTGVNQLATSILDRVPNVQETQFKTLMEATNQPHQLVGPRFNVYSYGLPGFHTNAHNATNPTYNPAAYPVSTQQDYNLRPRQLNHLAAYDTSAGRRASDGGANMELVLGEHQRRLHLAYARQLSNLPKATMKQQQQQSCHRDSGSSATQYLTDKSSNTNQEKDLSEEDEPNIEEIRRYLQSGRKRHTIAEFSEDINHQTPTTPFQPATTTTGFHHAVVANSNRPRYCRRQAPVLPTTTECESNPTSSNSPYQASDRHKRRSLDNASTIQQFQQTFNDRTTNVKNLQLEYQQLSKQYPSGHHATALPFDVQHRSRFNNRMIQQHVMTSSDQRDTYCGSSSPSQTAASDNHQALLHHLQKLHLPQNSSSPPPVTSNVVTSSPHLTPTSTYATSSTSRPADLPTTSAAWNRVHDVTAAVSSHEETVLLSSSSGNCDRMQHVINQQAADNYQTITVSSAQWFPRPGISSTLYHPNLPSVDENTEGNLYQCYMLSQPTYDKNELHNLYQNATSNDMHISYHHPLTTSSFMAPLQQTVLRLPRSVPEAAFQGEPIKWMNNL